MVEAESHHAPHNILEAKLSVIEEIERETRLKIALFLKRRGFSFEDPISCLAQEFPKDGALKVVQKFLTDAISRSFSQLKQCQLTVPYVNKVILQEITKIMRDLFRSPEIPET